MRKVKSVLPALLLGLALSACAPDPTACRVALGAPTLVFELYFGRSVPGRGELSEQEWRTFVDQTVTPALPNGYTVFDATGAWMSPGNGRTIRENTKVLLVALPDTPQSLAAVQRIRSAYQVKYHQQLIGMLVRKGCGSF